MPAYYKATVEQFKTTLDSAVRDELTRGYARDRYRDLKSLQIDAWRKQIDVLRNVLEAREPQSSKDWGLLLEFTIPRRMGRIDAVLLVGNAIVALEFKGESVDSAAALQVEDYALDLAYFHRPSREKPLYPIVVGARDYKSVAKREAPASNVAPVQFCTPATLPNTLSEIAAVHGGQLQVNVEDWNNGEYVPVPTIIEAAIGMFQEMQVDDIAHADADPKNLGRTVDALRRIILEAARRDEKVVCFVTGVPGAGKTLAGLKLVHDQTIRETTGSGMTFLSGNGPLVSVLRAALALDQRTRKNLRKHLALRDPKTLIQGVYSFKNTLWPTSNAPEERILVFDEAQRAWDQKTNIRKLAGDKPCQFSEPALVLNILERAARLGCTCLLDWRRPRNPYR